MVADDVIILTNQKVPFFGPVNPGSNTPLETVRWSGLSDSRMTEGRSGSMLKGMA